MRKIVKEIKKKMAQLVLRKMRTKQNVYAIGYRVF